MLLWMRNNTNTNDIRCRWHNLLVRFSSAEGIYKVLRSHTVGDITYLTVTLIFTCCCVLSVVMVLYLKWSRDSSTAILLVLVFLLRGCLSTACVHS